MERIAGPNAQRALRSIGAGEALEAAAGKDNDEPNRWFDFHIGDASHAHAGEFICSVRTAVLCIPEGRSSVLTNPSDRFKVAQCPGFLLQ